MAEYFKKLLSNNPPNSVVNYVVPQTKSSIIGINADAADAANAEDAVDVSQMNVSQMVSGDLQDTLTNIEAILSILAVGTSASGVGIPIAVGIGAVTLLLHVISSIYINNVELIETIEDTTIIIENIRLQYEFYNKVLEIYKINKETIKIQKLTYIKLIQLLLFLLSITPFNLENGEHSKLKHVLETIKNGTGHNSFLPNYLKKRAENIINMRLTNGGYLQQFQQTLSQMKRFGQRLLFPENLLIRLRNINFTLNVFTTSLFSGIMLIWDEQKVMNNDSKKLDTQIYSTVEYNNFKAHFLDAMAAIPPAVTPAVKYTPHGQVAININNVDDHIIEALSERHSITENEYDPNYKPGGKKMRSLKRRKLNKKRKTKKMKTIPRRKSNKNKK